MGETGSGDGGCDELLEISRFEAVWDEMLTNLPLDDVSKARDCWQPSLRQDSSPFLSCGKAAGDDSMMQNFTRLLVQRYNRCNETY